MTRNDSGECILPLAEMERLEQMVLRLREAYLALKDENITIKKNLASLEAEKVAALTEKEQLRKEHAEIHGRVAHLIQKIDFWDNSFASGISPEDENCPTIEPLQESSRLNEFS